MKEQKYIVETKECENIIKQCYGGKKLKIIEVQHAPLTNSFGIMGGHYNLTIKFQEDSGVIKEKSFFQKLVATKYKIQDEMIKVQGAFKKETFIYQIFNKELSKMNLNPPTPKCYLVKEDLYFVLENLVEEGFKLRVKENFYYDLPHLKLGLETLAKFHSGSIIYEVRTKRSLFEEFPSIFEDPIYRKDPNYLGNKLITSGYKTILKILDHCPHFEKNREEIKKIFEENVEEMFELVKPSKKYLNVINHGDLWATNLLFKYENDKDPVECKLVDFQALRYTIPAHDVMILIYNVTDLSTRDQYLSTLLEHYYSSLKTCLMENGLNLDDYLTFEEFDKSCRYIFPFALIQKSIYFLMMTTALHPEILNDEALFEKFLYEEEYKKKICVEEYLKKEQFYYIFNEICCEYHKLKPVRK